MNEGTVVEIVNILLEEGNTDVSLEEDLTGVLQKI